MTMFKAMFCLALIGCLPPIDRGYCASYQDIKERVERGEISERIKAMYDLVESGNPASFDLLVAMLKDPDENIRFVAAKLIIHSTDMLTINPLARCALHDNSYKVRMMAAETLYLRGIKSTLALVHAGLYHSAIEEHLIAVKIIERLRDTKSIEAIEKLLLTTPREHDLKLTCMQRALDILKNRIDSKKIEAAERVVLDAKQAFASNDYTKVRISLDEALGFDKQNADAYFIFGDLGLYVDKDYEKALRNYQLAQKYCYVQQGQVYYNIGTSLLFLKRYQEATEALKQAAWLLKDARSSYQLGYAFLELKDYDSAIMSMEMSVRLEPGFVDAHCALVELYKTKGSTALAQQHQMLCSR